MKLLFVTEFFPQDSRLVFTGGVEARTYYLKKLAENDFSVAVIASRFKQIPATSGSIFSRSLYLLLAFLKALKSDFDLIEGSNVVSYLPAFLAGKIKGKTTVAWIPDVLGRHWFELGFFVGLFGWLLEAISLKLPWDGVIALSRSTQTKLKKRGLGASQVTVIHGGIDPAEFQLTQKPTKFSRFTIICLARLVKTKRVSDLIQAFAKLSAATQLIIIGSGPQRQPLRSLTKNLGLQSRVKFIANLPRRQLIKTLTRAHLFCLPSIVEGFGLATIEAMQAGLPAVLADIHINQEVTRQGRGALFFQPQNTTDLAVKLNQLVTDKELYQQKSREAISLAKTYSWSKIYQQTKRFYESCHHS